MVSEICKLRENLHFLNNATFEVDDVIFAGTTLWTDIQKEQREISRNCNDYYMIKYKDAGVKRRLELEDTNRFHQENVIWLKGVLDNAKLIGKKVVVLSHHAPTGRNTLNDEERGTAIEEMDFTNLEYMMDPSVMMGWCFGHTHYSSDQMINGVRVVSNQHGYCMENIRVRTVDPYYLEEYVVDFSESEESITKRGRGFYKSDCIFI
jgi:3',5'-cyclic AMP phosphodiesterase CpdA